MNNVRKLKEIKMSISRAILLLLVPVVLIGCTTPSGYRQPVDKFQRASAVVVESTRSYTLELNKVERDAYLHRQMNKRAEVKLLDLEAAQVFDSEGIAARLQALAALAKYGALLSQLANSDAPERVEASAGSLGTALENLAETVGQLTGGEHDGFKKAVGPVTSVVGLIAKMVIEKKITEALDKAINDGEAPVKNLIELIANDITIAYERKRNALSDKRVELVDDYNASRQGDSEGLRVKTDRIIAHEDRLEAMANADPSEALHAMADAHAALVDYARSKKAAVDLATLVEAMETFAERAVIVANAIRAID